MLARAFTSRIKRSSRSASRHSQERSSSPAHPSPNPSKMGNTPSSQQSPKRKAGSIGKSSTLSSSVDMPGAEQPKSSIQVDREERVEESQESGTSAPEGSCAKKAGEEELELLIPPVAPEAEVPVPTEGERPNAEARAPDVEHQASHPQKHTWLPGTHVLVNARSGTALDLSGTDQRNLVGWPVHMGSNQQWEFIPSGKGYMIRSACPSQCGLYLTVEELHDNAPVIASSYPVSWNVELDKSAEDAIRISWPNTDFVLDLADWGNATPGTKVQLMRAKPGEPCQLWRFTRCTAAKDGEQEEKIARSETKPVVSETIIVSEGKEHVTTTRTTTTTTVTTVTTVTRTPRLGGGAQ